MSFSLFEQSGASFSPCRKYRYDLYRRFAGHTPIPGIYGYVNFIMLNPSTADEIRNDPTVERCERRA